MHIGAADESAEEADRQAGVDPAVAQAELDQGVERVAVARRGPDPRLDDDG